MGIVNQLIYQHEVTERLNKVRDISITLKEENRTKMYNLHEINSWEDLINTARGTANKSYNDYIDSITVQADSNQGMSTSFHRFIHEPDVYESVKRYLVVKSLFDDGLHSNAASFSNGDLLEVLIKRALQSLKGSIVGSKNGNIYNSSFNTGKAQINLKTITETSDKFGKAGSLDKSDFVVEGEPIQGDKKEIYRFSIKSSGATLASIPLLDIGASVLEDTTEEDKGYSQSVLEELEKTLDKEVKLFYQKNMSGFINEYFDYVNNIVMNDLRKWGGKQTPLSNWKIKDSTVKNLKSMIVSTITEEKNGAMELVHDLNGGSQMIKDILMNFTKVGIQYLATRGNVKTGAITSKSAISGEEVLTHADMSLFVGTVDDLINLKNWKIDLLTSKGLKGTTLDLSMTGSDIKEIADQIFEWIYIGQSSMKITKERVIATILSIAKDKKGRPLMSKERSIVRSILIKELNSNASSSKIAKNISDQTGGIVSQSRGIKKLMIAYVCYLNSADKKGEGKEVFKETLSNNPEILSHLRDVAFRVLEPKVAKEDVKKEIRGKIKKGKI